MKRPQLSSLSGMLPRQGPLNLDPLLGTNLKVVELEYVLMTFAILLIKFVPTIKPSGMKPKVPLPSSAS